MALPSTCAKKAPSGTGNGYTRGNDGHIERFREENGGKKRQPKPWFSKSWNISRRVLMEQIGKIVGDTFVGSFDELKKVAR